MSHRKAVVLTCIVALMWSLAGLNIKMISLTPYAISCGRSLIAAVVLFPWILKRGTLKLDRYAFGGAVCYLIFNYCFTVSTKLTTSAFAIMMQYTAPIYVAVFSRIFLKEKITKTDMACMASVFGGMLLFFSDGTGGGNPLGNAVAVVNGISFAGISMFLQMQKEGNPENSFFFGNVLAAIAGFPFLIQSGIPGASDTAFLILAGLLSAVSYTIYASASKGLSALESVLIPVIDPVMNPVWVFLFLGERPGWMSIIGAAVILTAVSIKVLKCQR